MDIVVRTPHGDADISIVDHDADTTLGELIGAITGQAVPRLALVDGRSVDCSVTLDEADLLIGSLVTTDPPLPSSSLTTGIDLVQVAGHGAGRIVRLESGSYRIGPGRRTNADELDLAPVERSAFELVVESTSTGTEVTVVPAGPDISLDGIAVTEARVWSDGTLGVGARAFRLDRSPRPDERSNGSRVPATHDHDGTVAFNRPPRRRNEPARQLVVDALRDATRSSPALWERRPDHPDAFSLPFGLTSEATPTASGAVGNVTIELADDRAVAITGSEQFRAALLRTLMVEAATLHGPADLDVVVLTTPDRVAEWDWAKWLPHLRIDGPVAIWSSVHDIRRWAQAVTSRATLAAVPPSASHLTIAVLDDAALWNRRDAPLRALMADPPSDLRLIAACNEPAQAPAICTSMISESGNGLAQLHSFTRTDDTNALRPALTEVSVAVRIARALAPLADVDLPLPAPTTGQPANRVGLGDLIDDISTDAVLARWSAGPGTSVAIGRRAQESIEVASNDDITVVVGPSMGDAFDVAATIVLAQCVDSPPAELWIVPLIVDSGDRAELLWQLPHATERDDQLVPPDPRRLLARLRAALAHPTGPGRILVVIEDSRVAASSHDTSLADAVTGEALTLPGLGVLVVTDRADTRFATSNGASPCTTIRVERETHVGDVEHRRTATVITSDGVTSARFSPLEPSQTSGSILELRPMVIGRPLTPLERRVEQQHARSSGSPDAALEAVVHSLRAAASLHPPTINDATPRLVVPPALPSRIDLEEFFASTPGDGVPLGLADDPISGGLRVHWWSPGDGSVLATGSRRSGIEQVVSTITLGLMDRFSADDIELVVVESSMTRRRALSSATPAPSVRSPDQISEITQMLDQIEAELERVAHNTAEMRRPRLIVVIGDLAQLGRQLADDELVIRLDHVLTAAAQPESGVDVIAYSGELAAAGTFAATVAQHLVGASSDRGELAALGIGDTADLEGIVGRCRSLPERELVQLAMPDAVMETLIARRSRSSTGESS